MSLRKSLQKYAFGQLLSAILAVTGLINGWLFEVKALNIPAMQAALTYTLILVGSSLYLLSERKRSASLLDLMMKYRAILLGSVLFDVAANWLVVKAFSELKIPEVMVFSGLSTPAAIAMAWLWTRPRPKYTRLQVMGVLMALSAIFFYFYLTQQDEMMTRSVTGIVCAVLSAFAYAASNNFQERVSHVMRPVEFLFGLGSIGSLVAWLSFFASFDEIALLPKILNDFSVLVLVFLYAVILSSFYLLIPVYMSKHSAVSFNFSLLTANFLGIIGSWFLLKATYSNWLYMSVALINFGLLIYYIGEESSAVSHVSESSDFESKQNDTSLESV